MPDYVMYVVIIVLGLTAQLPAYWAWRMIIAYVKRSRATPPVGESYPMPAVLLCLRGADPSLDACLNGLLNQDYPRYQVRIVVDNHEDTAWAKVHDILARGYPERVNVEVSVLEKPCAKCSLKCCAQLQTVSRLGPEVDAVVLLDADSIPAPDWLRAMVEPFADPTIGATTGMRWFAPVDCGWGSIMRHIFNSGSYPQMYAFDHAWGGSTAIRMDVFRRSSIKERWNRALCEDSAVTGPLRELGLRLVFAPAATNINHETITFPASVRFIQRQLLCVRLDHVDWPVLLGCNMANVVSIVSLLGIAGFAGYVERWDWLASSLGFVGFFSAAMYGALTTAEVIVRRNWRLRGLTPPAIVWTWRMVPGFFFTQVICMYLLIKAHVLRRVAWRGINYTIHGPGDIVMEKYEPYEPTTAQKKDAKHSAV